MLEFIKFHKWYLIYIGVLLVESIGIGTLCSSYTVASVFFTVMFLYMDCIGEFCGRFKMRCLTLGEMSDVLGQKTLQAFEYVIKRAEIHSKLVNNIRLFYIPSDEINAYSFGRKSIAITRGAMSLDPHLIEAVLSHEVGHSINADMFFYRFLFGNLISFIILLGIWNAFILGVVIIIGLIIILFSALRLNFVTYQISSWVIGLLKKILEMIQTIVLYIGQAIIAIVSRRCEYNADDFSYSLGYGNYLCMFLSKYAINYEAFKPRTIFEVIYASHPEPEQRINRLKEKGV